MYRFFVAVAIYCIIFAANTLFDKELRKAEKQTRMKIVSSANFRRGNILSFDGKPLAAYYPEYLLYTDFGVRISEKFTVDKNKVKTEKKAKYSVKLDTFRINIYKELARSFAKIEGGNANDYYRELYNSRIKAENAKRKENKENPGRYTENLLKRPITIFQRDEILENPFIRNRGRNVTGIYADEVSSRIPPFGDDFAHSVIGIVDEDNVSGIEKTYNENLKNGDDVITTIDTRMQDICETVLRNKISEDKRFVGGTIILMDVSTGDIKAMANLGSYNSEGSRNIHDIYNNATRATIEPGSTFKAVSLMLALETGNVRISDKFHTKKGRWSKTPEKHEYDSVLTVSEIIEHSLNTGTGNIVDKAFNKDVKKFIQAIKDLAIIDRIGNLNEIRPSINSNADSKSILPISHGYQVKMAPVHTLSFYNAIANNGVMVKPRLVCGIIDRSNGEKEIFEPEIINPSICSKTTLDSVRLVLSRVVGRGSAARIAGSPYGIIGKTGTAQIYIEKKNYKIAGDLSRELASFCGYFPQRAPQYSCIVVLYTRFLNKWERKDFSASSTAVPLFRKVSDKIYALYVDKKFTPSKNSTNIPVIKSTRRKNLSIISEKLNLPITVDNGLWLKVDTANKKLQTVELSVKKGIIPDVTGMGLRDAVFLLENRGMIVSCSGVGTIVKQSPEKGVTYNSGQKIYLTLSANQTEENDENK
jgi:cell division protein FtsI (penicillin-binding protein 3)